MEQTRQMGNDEDEESRAVSPTMDHSYLDGVTHPRALSILTDTQSLLQSDLGRSPVSMENV